jgi:hypothetical protein
MLESATAQLFATCWKARRQSIASFFLSFMFLTEVLLSGALLTTLNNS